ncbi:MAG: PEP-CTERM sorting domain-containing protein [Candidatus Thiodiazotropha sp.]
MNKILRLLLASSLLYASSVNAAIMQMSSSYNADGDLIVSIADLDPLWDYQFTRFMTYNSHLNLGVHPTITSLEPGDGHHVFEWSIIGPHVDAYDYNNSESTHFVISNYDFSLPLVGSHALIPVDNPESEWDWVQYSYVIPPNEVESVPEPSTLFLLGAGIIGIGATRLRKKS